MANYQTHVTVGTGAGAIAGAAAMTLLQGTEPAVLLLGAFFGFLGGMVPDLDHDRGHAIDQISALFSTFLPLVLMAFWVRGAGNWTVWSIVFVLPCHYLLHWALPQLSIFAAKGRTAWRTALMATLVAAICAVPSVFFFKQLPFPLPLAWAAMVGVALIVQLSVPLIKYTTVHRGIWHSIPVVVIYAELTYLFLENFTRSTRLIVAGAALAGALSHLILDEIYSVDFNGMRIKRSFGTALKWWDSKSPISSLLVYLIAAGLGVLCVVF